MCVCVCVLLCEIAHSECPFDTSIEAKDAVAAVSQLLHVRLVSQCNQSGQTSLSNLPLSTKIVCLVGVLIVVCVTVAGLLAVPFAPLAGTMLLA